MTREEAIRKVMPIEDRACWSRGSAATIIDTLEALGLIKFEEDKNEVLEAVFRQCGITKSNVDALASRGYSVRKIGV